MGKGYTVALGKGNWKVISSQRGAQRDKLFVVLVPIVLNSGLLKITVTFFQQLWGYSDATTDSVFIKKTWKTPIIDEKNMVNMKFDEHKYVSKVPCLGNITNMILQHGSWKSSV